MVKLTRIYTRGGDKGETSLGDGRRVAKHDPRVAAYGTVDEANACLGLARLHCGGEVDEILARAQNDLFDLGADLCRPQKDDPKKPSLRISTAQVEEVVLDPPEHGVEGALGMEPHQADGGVGLVDGAVGGDPGIVLGDPRAVAQRGLAAIAAPGVDARQLDH